MQNQDQKPSSCSKDALKQYKILQAHFTEGLLSVLLNHLLFSVGCVIPCYRKYASGTILKICRSVPFRCSHTVLFSHYEVLTVSIPWLVFNLNLMFKRCDGKRQCIYWTVQLTYYIKLNFQ